MQTDLLASLNDNQDLAKQLCSAAFVFERAWLSTIHCKSLENANVGAHVLQVVQEANHLSVYGELNFQGKDSH